MQSKESFATLRRVLLGATSIAVIGTASAAQAASELKVGDAPYTASGGTYASNALVSEETPGIVVRDDLDPNQPGSGGALDTGVTGVGQMIAFIQSATNPNAAGLSLCSGTLINPRTVIFAAHCVNARPAHLYGSQTGTGGGTSPVFGSTQGVPLSFGFEATNRCLADNPATPTNEGNGCAVGTGPYERWRDTAFQTQVNKHIYNANQIWYDTRSLTTPGSAGFIVADIAVATLDTPAFNVPTWAMLFSPLDGPTHALQMGYGVNGTSASAQGGAPCVATPTDNCSPRGAIDYRRRAAENMISVLGSLADRNIIVFGGAFGATTNNLYMLDFDSPSGPAGFSSPTNFDFDIFLGAALPREGTTAGGDSGGPLVVDQKYNRQVVAGVLSGGSRFFGAQRFSTYGTHSFYQPLHLYWDQIVLNNPYIYAGNKGGDGAWEDAGHWIQLMDPSYLIDANGQLVNSLPDTLGQGIAAGGAKFGTICNGPCASLAGTQPTGNGTPIFIEGGPGSTNFVPNNVEPINSATPGLTRKARYYDVTLSQPGATTLSSAVVIDRFTMDGPTKLDVKGGGGSLRVLGEYTQIAGWTNVDGLVRSGGDALIVSGLLSGVGTFKAPFLTVGAAILAPGGADNLGTLTIDGNAILSSGSALFIDAGRAGADKLAVTGSLTLSQNSAGQGPSLVMNKAKGAAPRHGQSFTIAESSALTGTFGQVFAFQGVLRPELTYTSTSVIANLRAGSLANQIGQSGPTEIAFARALDQLRGNSYNALFGLYGVVDLMDGPTLSRTLAGLSPSGIAGEAVSLQEKQSRVMLDAVTNRLSSLGTGGTSGTLSIVGSPQSVVAMQMGGTGFAAGSTRFDSAQSLVPTAGRTMAMPRGFSGFISGGVSTAGSTFGDNRAELAGQRNWHIGMGLEAAVSERATLGTAFGFAQGVGRPSGETARTDSRMTQAAVYGSYRLGGGAYLAGLASAESSRTDIDRQAGLGDAAFALTGATKASRYMAMAEAGVNLGVGQGLTLTPRASLGYSSYQLSGFREGGGELALQVDDLRLSRMEAKLGLKFAGSAKLAHGWSFVPQLQADYVRGLSGANNGLSVRFASAPDVAFLLPLAGGDTDWAEVKGGMKLVNGPFEIGAGVQSALGRSDFSDERAVADFTFRF